MWTVCLSNDWGSVSHISLLYCTVISWYFSHQLKMPDQLFAAAHWCSVCVQFKLLSVGWGCVLQNNTHIIVKWIFTLWTSALALSLSLSHWRGFCAFMFAHPNCGWKFHNPDGISPHSQKSASLTCMSYGHVDKVAVCGAKCNRIAGTVHYDII